MTRIPFLEHHNIKVGEGQPYKVNAVCSAPGCAFPMDDAHHIVRRSFTATGEYEWWIEYKGVTIGNITGLCHEHHQLITENKAALGYDETTKSFFWVDQEAGEIIGDLQTQPPVRYTVVVDPDPGDVTEYDWVRDPEDRLDNSEQHFHGPGAVAKCGECKRPLPRPKEKTEDARPRRTWSVTVPVDSRENGAAALDALMDECADLFGHSGTKATKYFTLAQALALVVQHGTQMVGAE